MCIAVSMGGRRMVRSMKNGSSRYSSLIRKPSHSEHGFVYLWALFSVVLAGVAIAGAGQMWQVKSQRDKEAELMFIGEEFRKAIMSYHNANKQYPSTLEDLLKDSRSVNIKRHLRKIYTDPMTNSTDWGLVDEPPPATTTAASKAGAAQNKNSTGSSSTTSSTGSSSGSTASTGTGSTNSSTTNPNQSSALNQTGSTGQTTASGQTSTTNPGSNVGTTPESKPPVTSSSGMSSSIGTKITGVYSLSERKPIKKDRFPEQYAKFKEALSYRDWQFIYKLDAKSSGTSGSGASSTKSGGASTPGAANSPFSSSNSSSSRGSASSSSGSSASGSGSPFGSPSQSGASGSGAGSSPFGSSANDD